MIAIFASLIVGSLLLPCILIGLVVCLVDWIEKLREAKRARIEAELDRTQAELRATILRLASALGAEAHEARKALIRESFLASRHENGSPR